MSTLSQAGRAPAAPPQRRLRRLEGPALAGVLVREVINFSSYWRSTTFSSTVEPTIYLLAFGFGFGSLVSEVGGYPYVEFVGTGTVATAVLFSSAFPAMFGTLVKRQYQRTYDAILAAPVEQRGAGHGGGRLDRGPGGRLRLRADARGDVLRAAPELGMLAVPFIACVAGFGWAGFGIAIASRMDSFENFSYIISAVLTPLFLVAGTFFPIDELPEWAQVLAQLNPLYHCVELVRDAVFGWEGWADLVHAGVLIAFGLAMWRLAVWGMTRKLID